VNFSYAADVRGRLLNPLSRGKQWFARTVGAKPDYPVSFAPLGRGAIADYMPDEHRYIRRVQVMATLDYPALVA
jgi:hypothetical protein